MRQTSQISSSWRPETLGASHRVGCFVVRLVTDTTTPGAGQMYIRCKCWMDDSLDWPPQSVIVNCCLWVDGSLAKSWRKFFFCEVRFRGPIKGVLARSPLASGHWIASGSLHQSLTISQMLMLASCYCFGVSCWDCSISLTRVVAG